MPRYEPNERWNPRMNDRFPEAYASGASDRLGSIAAVRPPLNVRFSSAPIRHLPFRCRPIPDVRAHVPNVHFGSGAADELPSVNDRYASWRPERPKGCSNSGHEMPARDVWEAAGPTSAVAMDTAVSRPRQFGDVPAKPAIGAERAGLAEVPLIPRCLRHPRGRADWRRCSVAS